MAKEEQTEEGRRKLTLQLRELEGQLEEERKQRTAAQNGRKKLDSDIHDLQVQLDAEGKGKEELQRQLKKVQVSCRGNEAGFMYRREFYTMPTTLLRQLMHVSNMSLCFFYHDQLVVLVS